MNELSDSLPISRVSGLKRFVLILKLVEQTFELLMLFIVFCDRCSLRFETMSNEHPNQFGKGYTKTIRTVSNLPCQYRVNPCGYRDPVFLIVSVQFSHCSRQFSPKV